MPLPCVMLIKIWQIATKKLNYPFNVTKVDHESIQKWYASGVSASSYFTTRNRPQVGSSTTGTLPQVGSSNTGTLPQVGSSTITMNPAYQTAINQGRLFMCLCAIWTVIFLKLHLVVSVMTQFCEVCFFFIILNCSLKRKKIS